MKIQKIYILRDEIVAKTRLKNAKFFWKLKMGAHEQRIDGKLVG